MVHSQLIYLLQMVMFHSYVNVYQRVLSKNTLKVTLQQFFSIFHSQKPQKLTKKDLPKSVELQLAGGLQHA